MADIQEEQQRENEGLLESVRAASKEDKYLQLVMDSYIPKEYQVRTRIDSIIKRKPLLFDFFLSSYVLLIWHSFSTLR